MTLLTIGLFTILFIINLGIIYRLSAIEKEINKVYEKFESEIHHLLEYIIILTKGDCNLLKRIKHIEHILGIRK